MSEPSRKSQIDLDPLERKALSWVEHMTSGQATLADAEALVRWRQESPAHDAAFAEARRLWDDLGPAGRRLRQHHAASPGLVVSSLPRRTASRRRVLRYGFAAAATSTAAAYTVVSPPFGLWPSWRELSADYRTGTGEQREVAVADDISVHLNTQTSIAVRSVAGEAARFELIAGEASFSTAAQAGRSLVVLAAKGRTIARRAKFDMRCVGSSVCVTGIEGEIRIEQQTDAVSIGPGQQVSYDGHGLGEVATVDTDATSAWQRGVLIFRDVPLATVVDEINRYRPGKVVLLDAALGRELISGRFRIDHIDDVLGRIEQVFDARIRSLPGGIVLLG
jgi:transmembrane sensor